MAGRIGAGGWCVLAAMAMLAAACGGGGKAAAPKPTTTTSASTTTTTLDPKQQVIAAYENSLEQYRRVAGDPSGRPDDPILQGTMTPKFGQQVSVNIFGLRNLHRYTKGNVLVTPQQVDVQDRSATMLACVRDDSDQFDQSGKDVSPHPGPGTPMQVKVVLQRSQDGRWLVDQNSPTGTSCTV